MVQQVIGGVINPRTDLFFKSVEYRTHQFTFTLIPRTIQEAWAIDAILNIFQYYMLPSFGDDSVNAAGVPNAPNDSFFIGYPYEFEISMFSQVSGSAHHLNSFERSVLTDIRIDHASGNRVAFVDSYGGNEYFPASTTLSLGFKETRLQGRDKQTVIWRGTQNQKPDSYRGKNDPRAGSDIGSRTANLRTLGQQLWDTQYDNALSVVTGAVDKILGNE